MQRKILCLPIEFDGVGLVVVPGISGPQLVVIQVDPFLVDAAVDHRAGLPAAERKRFLEHARRLSEQKLFLFHDLPPINAVFHKIILLVRFYVNINVEVL